MRVDKFIVSHLRAIRGDLKIIGSLEATTENITTVPFVKRAFDEFTYHIDDNVVQKDLNFSKSNEKGMLQSP